MFYNSNAPSLDDNFTVIWWHLSAWSNEHNTIYNLESSISFDALSSSCFSWLFLFSIKRSYDYYIGMNSCCYEKGLNVYEATSKTIFYKIEDYICLTTIGSYKNMSLYGSWIFHENNISCHIVYHYSIWPFKNKLEFTRIIGTSQQVCHVIFITSKESFAFFNITYKVFIY